MQWSRSATNICTGSGIEANLSEANESASEHQDLIANA